MQRVILMGKGELAIRVGNWFMQSDKYMVVAVVPVMPEPTWCPSLTTWAKENRLPIIESGHFKDITDVRDQHWKIDLVMSVFYDKIFKAWFIDKCNRILNIHNAPLPKYRGMAPINWALKNNESHHGVTIHEITPGIDEGPIVSQLTYSIYPETDEVIDVYDRSIEYAWTLFQQTMPLLDKIKVTEQDHAIATYHHASDSDLLQERNGFTRK